jgi:hypothetical protein
METLSPAAQVAGIIVLGIVMIVWILAMATNFFDKD